MRKLYFTTGSPFARAVRIVLAEKGLEYERDETVTTTAPEVRAQFTPTLQVPTFVDGDKVLWDSTVILDYLMATYPNREAVPGEQSFASDYVRSDHEWEDKLTHATLQSLGVSTATISQLLWSGIRYNENGHGERSAIRNQSLLDWFETRLVSADEGLVPGVASVQDVLLACWCLFIERRPLGITWEAEHRPKVTALVRRMEQRQSFGHNPVLWWEPGVTYGTAEERAWAAEKTTSRGPTFSEWKCTR